MELVRLPDADYVKSTLEEIEYKIDTSRDLIDTFMKSFTETDVIDTTPDKLFKRYEELSIMLIGAEQVLDGTVYAVNLFGTYLEQHSA